MGVRGNLALLAHIALGVTLAMLVAVGLATALARSRRARRRPLLLALIAALVVTAVGGVAWVAARHGPSAPVSANLTLFTQSLDCSHVSGTCGLPNALYAVRADTGAVRWEVVEQPPAYFVGSTPLFDNGVVYAYIYPGPSATVGSMDNYQLVAWRGRDGVELWRRRVFAPCCEAPLTFVAGSNLAMLDFSGPTSDGSLVWSLALMRASDGARVGETRLPGRDFPAVVGNIVYQCLPDKTIVAMRLSDGALIWRSSAAAADAAQTAPRCVIMENDGKVFVSMPAASVGGVTQRNGELLALDGATGQAIWRYATPTPQPLAVGDGLVVLGEGAQYDPTSIVALRASDGALAWRHAGLPPPPAIKGYNSQRTAAVGDGLVLVGGGSYTLWALRAATGRVAWQITSDYHALQTVAFVGSAVFVRTLYTGSGALFSVPFVDSHSYFSAYRASDGAPYWQTTVDSGGGAAGGGQAIGAV